MNKNMLESIYDRSSINFPHFVSIVKNMADIGNSFFWFVIFYRNVVNSCFFVLHEADLEKNIELRIKILERV
jgi:hypothetical protein